MGRRTEIFRKACVAALRQFDAKLQRRYEPYLAHFRKVVGYQPSIALPRRYHEKMLWRKLFDHSPQIAMFCDKLATKDYIRARLPSLRVPETLWVGDCLEDIPADLLRQKIMIKCNHGCAFNRAWIPGCSDFKELSFFCREWLTNTYGTTNYEWGYSALKPKVYAEEHLEAPTSFGLVDIKVRCCDGEPHLVRIHLDGSQREKRAGWFDPKGQRLFRGSGPLAEGDRDLPEEFPLPSNFFDAIEAAGTLGRGVDYARFDFLTDNRQLLAGEITVYPAAGLGAASVNGITGPDTLTNKNWDIRKSWFLTEPQRGFAAVYALALKAALD